MKLGLATVAAFVALGAAAPAHASTPVPWCGTGSSAADRAPDATLAYSVHVAYVRAPGAPDRFAQFAPRIVGDTAAFDAWWRGQDSTRTPRFDLFPAPGCASTFGSLDISSLELPQPIGKIDPSIDASVDNAFDNVRGQLARLGFHRTEKVYLVYVDGPTGQTGTARVCGVGAAPSRRGPGIALVFLDSCDADAGDTSRPLVALHELVHVLGAVDPRAPSFCRNPKLYGHACDTGVEGVDLMAPAANDDPLESHVLDAGRNDYYAHSGAWTDVQDSIFLERLDSPDRTPPTTPSDLVVGDGPPGFVRVSWSPAMDDVGPVLYRVYEGGEFVSQVTTSSVLLPVTGATTRYSVRAADQVGRLGAPIAARFRPDLGMIDDSGRLIRDTVRPPSIVRYTVKRLAQAVVLSWPAVRDGGGLRGYRIKIGTRILTVSKPTATIARSKIAGAVSISAVDRAGNAGPAVVISRSRLR